MPVYTSEPKPNRNRNKEYNKPNNVVIGDNAVDNTKKPIGYICPNCRCRMFKIGVREYGCEHCSRVEYIAEEDPNSDSNLAKSSSIPKPVTLDTDDDDSIGIATIHAEPINFFTKKKQEYKGAFKTLSDRGIRITNYWDNEKEEE